MTHLQTNLRNSNLLGLYDSPERRQGVQQQLPVSTGDDATIKDGDAAGVRLGP